MSVTSFQNLTLAEVLQRFKTGKDNGVFTDGCSQPNPGPGGWGAVWVQNNEVVEQRYGHSPDTTNNRMELTGIIEAYRMLPLDAEVSIFTDSNLCVQTVNTWAAGWKARGWKRKDGPIANLELVQELYELAQKHPKVKLQWVKAHNGDRWNEYADSLANAWARDTL